MADVADGRSLVVAGPDGSGSVPSALLTLGHGTSLGVHGVSRDGDRILFSKTARGAGERSLWSVGVDGSGARLLVAGTSQGDWLSR